MAHSPPLINPRSGYSPATKTFHSLRPTVPLPPVSLPLSFTSYLVSLLPDRFPSHPAFINASTGLSLSYPDLVSQIHSLASSLHSHLGISKGHVAFILSTSCLEIPILYLSLLSLGAIVTPANPATTPSELSRLIDLAGPTHFFATSSSSSMLPHHVTPVLIDSPLFRSFLESGSGSQLSDPIEIRQSDPAAILFSSGTTGRLKAAAIPHREFIANTAEFHALRSSETETMLLTAPMFHSMGFLMALKGVALVETTVLMGSAPVEKMLEIAAKYKVTRISAAPTIVVALTQSEDTVKFDLSALRQVCCGGAPLVCDAAERFQALFPSVEIAQGYGATEAGLVSRMIGPEECKHWRSVGRLNANMEAKIVDHVTGHPLSLGQHGELWVRGPTIMLGYIGDPEANAVTFDSEGWLKTGDLCYFDEDGFLYIVDRLKEMIKYKAYQVAPAELEQVLHSLPDVVEAAVVPCPDEIAGQIPMAFVVRKPGSKLSGEDVIKFTAQLVAPYKKIRRVAFINSIPKTPSGKIMRRDLANRFFSSSTSKL
ncbi:4-coumarate--CoA ligase-like 7 [Dioscorea cayenensis subsp. rotundata]|uniref:4-coumarate--CoA ligase n=1 Tax=Dioscorea cayennensis subsp. rotundata TaxID=55577 RepID=A0AB40BDL2_DIOCR|nr:4-coumarate--CoA ligase-like 7 [Dioscorea cayenensis subsp. rotundata]